MFPFIDSICSDGMIQAGDIRELVLVGITKKITSEKITNLSFQIKRSSFIYFVLFILLVYSI